MYRFLRLLPLCAALCACHPRQALPQTATDAGASGDDGGTGTRGAGLFARLAGLWSGPAAQTPLGSFPDMNMDFGAADSHWLFGRVDLDPADSLRFGFAVESVAGQPTLVFRNGGYFHGVERDTDTVLVDADEDAGTYHFCAESSGCFFSVDGGCLPVSGGCGFVDAVFSFSAPDQMIFNAHVNGEEHLIWTVTRKESRTIPTPFPADSSALSTDASWPDLPQLSVTVTWTQPLASATDVWVILSATQCASLGSPGFTCSPSRTESLSAPSGATSVTVPIDQILPGSYYAVALVDIAGGFASTLAPESGDGVSDPAAMVSVSSQSGTGTLPIVYYLP
jgi:hypothetical protein